MFSSHKQIMSAVQLVFTILLLDKDQLHIWEEQHIHLLWLTIGEKFMGSRTVGQLTCPKKTGENNGLQLQGSLMSVRRVRPAGSNSQLQTLFYLCLDQCHLKTSKSSNGNEDCVPVRTHGVGWDIREGGGETQCTQGGRDSLSVSYEMEVHQVQNKRTIESNLLKRVYFHICINMHVLIRHRLCAM